MILIRMTRTQIFGIHQHLKLRKRSLQNGEQVEEVKEIVELLLETKHLEVTH
jgi:hypothetical protein